jgi:hypothetical protein
LIRNQPIGPRPEIKESGGVNLLKVVEATSTPWRMTEFQSTSEYSRQVAREHSMSQQAHQRTDISSTDQTLRQKNELQLRLLLSDQGH